MTKEIRVDKKEIESRTERIAHSIVDTCIVEKLAVVGIKTRGEYIANRLIQKIKQITGVSVPSGAIDITLYRDDFRNRIDWPVLKQTDLNFNIEGMDIVLVDDVIYTGRTTRAAIDAIMDYGRPSSIKLAVLVDRGHRELPIQPDFTGINIATKKNQVVKVFLNECDGREEITVN